jgi:hypothetical protein
VAHSQATNLSDVETTGPGSIVPARPVSDETQTDADGRFEAVMVTPGVGMLSFEPAKDFAPMKHFVYDQRGDLGVIKLRRGAAIRGKLVDVEGKPEAEVQVTAAPWNTTEPRISKRGSDQQQIDEEIHAAAMTAADGDFDLGRLPAGEYRVEPREYLGGRKVNAAGAYYNDIHLVPGLFVPRRIKLVDGQDLPPIELRAVSTVAIEGHITYSPLPPNSPARAGGAQVGFGGTTGRGSLRGRFSNYSAPSVQGMFGGLPFRVTLVPSDADGSFKAVVPRGLGDTVIEIPTAYRPVAPSGGEEAIQAQWRLGKESPPQSTQRIRLGKLEKDLMDVEIEYAPTAEQIEARRGAAQAILDRGGLGGGPAPGRASGGGPQAAGRGARGGVRGAIGGAAQPIQQPADGNGEDAGK